jgi:hypothetical protein
MSYLFFKVRGLDNGANYNFQLDQFPLPPNPLIIANAQPRPGWDFNKAPRFEGELGGIPILVAERAGGELQEGAGMFDDRGEMEQGRQFGVVLGAVGGDPQAGRLGHLGDT